jgi:LCP family protein required for cell wall assembly
MDNKQFRPRFIEDIKKTRQLGGSTYAPPAGTGRIAPFRPQRPPAENSMAGTARASRATDFLNNGPSKPGTAQPRPLLNTTLPNNSYNNRFAGSANGQKVKVKKRRWVARHKVITSLVLLLVLIGGGLSWFSSGVIGNLDKVFHGNLFSDVQALFSTTRLNGEAQGRVNILLAGYQGVNSDEGALTDSIMIVSLDTRNNTAFTLSIPRDLLVRIPGMGYQKINAANTAYKFSQPGYFSGGMGQLQQIVEQNFGIPIQYYALINYNAFEDAVNAVGGITIVIHSPDPRGLYDPNVNKAHGGPVKLPNGPVTLNGIHALALALARGDSPYAYGFPLSDINREQHQRQMLIALEQKAFSAGVLSNPIKVTHLFDAIGTNVSTDLSLADALRLVQLMKAVNINNIKSYGLSYGGRNSLLSTYYSPNTGDSLIPAAGLNNYTQIQNFYKSITAPPPPASAKP